MAKQYDTKKSLKTLPNPNGSLVVIAWEGGGQVPEELSGVYTTHSDAKRAIVSWYATNNREEQIDEPITSVTLGQIEDKKLEAKVEKRKTLTLKSAEE